MNYTGIKGSVTHETSFLLRILPPGVEIVIKTTLELVAVSGTEYTFAFRIIDS